jgi:hypothetical protein
MVQACRAAPGCFSALLLLEPMVRLSQS